MAIVEAVILLIAFVVISNIVDHYLVAIPVSLIQIVIGLLIALIFKFSIPLNTDWFMLLFIAPLLFNDGRHFPKRELWSLRGPIIANAILLVFITTFLGGYLIHYLIPGLPLSASFALSAILSPTDPIAVQSISERAKLPANILHLVSGESLINDASGLIGFKYGLAATITGIFSLSHAVGDFIYISIAGAFIGFVMILILQFLKRFFLRQGINDVILHTILQVGAPFLIYLIAEEVFHASGVIAVVTAGILNSTQRNPYSDYYLAELNIVSERTWDLVVYILNGIVFLILGIELPVAFGDVIKSHATSTGAAILYVLITWLGLFLIRTFWTYGYGLLSYLRDKKNNPKPIVSVALLSGLTGVRGAITMAGVLSVPIVLENGQAFPERPLMLFVAAGVILMSLLSAIIFIPLLVPNGKPLRLRGSLPTNDEEAETISDNQVNVVPTPQPQHYTLAQAQSYMYQVAIHRIESEQRQENQRAALDLIGEYQFMIRRVELNASDQSLPPILQDEITLDQVGITGELETLDHLWETNQIQAKTYRNYQANLLRRRKDLNEINNRSFRVKVGLYFFRLQVQMNHLMAELTIQKNSEQFFYSESLFAERQMAKGGIKAISTFLKQSENRKKNFNRQVIYQIITRYRRRIVNLKNIGNQRTVAYEHQLALLRTHALASQRGTVQDMVERGLISNGQAAKLRQQINYTENAMALTTDEPAR